MGEFVFMSAFRGADVSRTATAAELFCARHGVRAVDPPLRASAMTAPRSAMVMVWDDGDFWRQAVLHKGTVVDRFCSDLNYFGRQERQRLGGRWDGDPSVVADALGLDPGVVQHYYRQPARFLQPKRLSGDKFSAADPWIFTDLWHRIGISYPSASPDLQLELPGDFADNLPVERIDF